MEIFRYVEIILDMENNPVYGNKHHELLHQKIISRKNINVVNDIIYTLTHFINTC